MSQQRTSKVKCTGIGEMPSKAGTPQLVYDLVVVEPCDGRKRGDTIKFFQPVTENTLGFVQEQLRNMGMTNTDHTKPEGLGSILVNIVEEFESYNGKQRWKSRYINPLKKPVAELAEEDHDAMRAMIMGALEDVPAVEITEENAAPKTVEAETPEEDF